MARKSGTYEITVFKHGLIWWFLIGWWWRPIMYFFTFLFCDLLGSKYLKTTVIDNRADFYYSPSKHGVFWWLLVGWWWRLIVIITLYFFCLCIGRKFKFA